jgi:hypothetical protein
MPSPSSTQNVPNDGASELAAKLADIERRIRTLETSPRVAFSSIADRYNELRVLLGDLQDGDYGIQIYDSLGSTVFRADDDGLTAIVDTGGLTINGGIVRAIEVAVGYEEYTAVVVPVTDTWTDLDALDFTRPAWATSALVQAAHSAQIGNLTGSQILGTTRIVIEGTNSKNINVTVPNNTSYPATPTMARIILGPDTSINVTAQSKASGGGGGNASADRMLSATVFWLV